jgi:hypothetical protein
MKPLAGIARTNAAVLFAALAATALASPGARAATISLNGSGAMSYSFQFVAPNSSSPTAADDYDLAVPGQYTFTDTFTTQQSPTQNLGTSAVGPYDFQDSYRFTVGANASGDTLLATLGLGGLFSIANLQFRLYEVPAATTQPNIGGIPAGSTLITSWMGLPTGSNSVSAEFNGIQNGTYILDVAGIASGTGGGNYIGSLNLQPVPLPAALGLFLSGLGGLATLARRRRAAA